MKDECLNEIKDESLQRHLIHLQVFLLKVLVFFFVPLNPDALFVYNQIHISLSLCENKIPTLSFSNILYFFPPLPSYPIRIILSEYLHFSLLLLSHHPLLKLELLNTSVLVQVFLFTY